MTDDLKERVFVVEVKSILANRTLNTEKQALCYYTNKHSDICQYAAPRYSKYQVCHALEANNIDDAVNEAINALKKGRVNDK